MFVQISTNQTRIGMSNEEHQEEQKKCPCCGANMIPNKQGLTKGLVNILIKFKRAMLESQSPEFNKLHAQRDVNFTKNEYNNFQKLRYFGLVAKCKDKNGVRESGYWLLTRNGNKFCKGEITMPKFVITFRNTILEKSDERIDVKKAIKSEEYPYFQTDFQHPLVDISDMAVLPEIKTDEKGQTFMPFGSDEEE